MLLDSHIHIFREKDIPTLAWQDPNGPLYGRYDLEDYLSEISPMPDDFSGFIFLETDRKYNIPSNASEEAQAWEYVVEEYRYVLKLSKESKLVRGIVPWAPIKLGREVMERYQRLLEEVDKEVYGSEKHGLLVGYRYLLQDKPDGECLEPKFIEGLEFVRDSGKVFDLGVDVNRRGVAQFEEALEALSKVDSLKVVINHLSKPPLGREPEEGMEAWKKAVTAIARYENVSVKLSGSFAELPNGLSKLDGKLPHEKIRDMAQLYASHLFREFGPRRILWASDWPVCGIGYEQIMGDKKGVWHAWLAMSKELVENIRRAEEIEAAAEDWEGIWGGNAVTVYSLPNNA